MDRFEIIKRVERPQKKQDALERAAELCNAPLAAIPAIAHEYVGELLKNNPLCARIFIIAYAHYAQAIEGLAVEDSGFKITRESQIWFDQRNIEKRRDFFVAVREKLVLRLEGVTDVRQRIMLILSDAINDFNIAGPETRHLVLDSYCEILALSFQEAMKK